MKPLLYAHPFASYCQKVLVALYENDTPFSYRKLVPEDPSAMSEFGKLCHLKNCAASASLFYSDWVHEIGEKYGHLRAYRKRLLERSSIARTVEEARPYRKFFPPGAPNRD